MKFIEYIPLNHPSQDRFQNKQHHTQTKPSIESMKLHPSNALKAGFSLVEMLVVIAVIGIIAAIAVPNIGRINDSAKEATNRRNAQNLASVYASAQAAGLRFGGTSTTPADIVKEIVKGGTVTDQGPFKDTYFGVPGLSGKDQEGALDHLKWEGGSLVYTGHAEEEKE